MTAGSLDELLAALDAGETIRGGTPLHEAMHAASQEAIRLTTELNASYHSPDEVVDIMTRLTGRDVDPTFRLFPPFHTDFGKNLRLGARVFINSGASFQDQGGITIGDDALIGHNAMLATLNHDEDPARRADMHPAPIVIGAGAWLGANVTVVPGVTIGEGAIVGAGSIVTRDVPPHVIAVGAPARVVREVRAGDAADG